jgi:hypothetical protein
MEFHRTRTECHHLTHCWCYQYQKKSHSLVVSYLVFLIVLLQDFISVPVIAWLSSYVQVTLNV